VKRSCRRCRKIPRDIIGLMFLCERLGYKEFVCVRLAIQGMMKKVADREKITTKLNEIQALMRKMNLRADGDFEWL